MTLYTVFIRDGEPGEAMPRLVADRFSWFAALLPPVFFVAHGLWLALLGFVLFVAALAGASLWLGPDAVGWAYIAGVLLIGFEAPSLVRSNLRRKGFSHTGERFGGDPDGTAAAWIASRPRPLAVVEEMSS